MFERINLIRYSKWKIIHSKKTDKKNKQRTRFFVLLVVLTVGNSNTVLAATQVNTPTATQVNSLANTQVSVIPVPTNLEELFDADYYAFLYPDVVLTYGSDKKKLYEHFLTYGLLENRCCSKLLHIAKYQSLYPDLKEAFGDDINQYVQHFFTYGVYEGRSSGIKSADTVYQFAIANRIPIDQAVTLLKSAANTVLENKTQNIANSVIIDEQTTINVSDSGIISDTEGNILIPWELVNREPYLTLESLKARLGDSLVLVTDVDGKITFVGGNFSSVKVTDSASAMESLHCMMKLLEFPEDTRVLELVNSGRDSDDNTFYRFAVKTKEGLYFDNTSIIVSSNSNGEVLSVSSSCSNRWNTEPIGSLMDIEGISEELRNMGYVFLNDQFESAYNSLTNMSYWYNYYTDVETGKLMKMHIYSYGGKSVYGISVLGDENAAVDLSTNIIPYTHLLNDERETVYKDFIDYYGNIVSLPCIEENGKWFLYDKENRLISMYGIGTASEDIFYFDEDYFHFVETYKIILPVQINY